MALEHLALLKLYSLILTPGEFNQTEGGKEELEGKDRPPLVAITKAQAACPNLARFGSSIGGFFGEEGWVMMLMKDHIGLRGFRPAPMPGLWSCV